MFLRPQHFQQQDRCFEHLVREALLVRHPYLWGVSSVDVDRGLLEAGQLAVPRARGILPDGTPFRVPEDQDPPKPFAVPGDVREQVVVLAAPVDPEPAAAAEILSAAGLPPRYEQREITVCDTAPISLGSKADIEIGRLRLELKLETAARDGWNAIPLVRVREVRSSDGKIVLDEDFIPSCIDHRASTQLVSFVRQVAGLLAQRCEVLAGRVSLAGRGGVAELADFLLLQIVNRNEPVFRHLAEAGGLHPEELYRQLLAVAGELATFTTEAKRLGAVPEYRHSRLIESFRTLEEAIIRSLTSVLEPTATAIPIEDVRFGIRRAIIHDRSLLDSATFVLEVSADMDPDTLVRAFRDQSKVASSDKIRELVNHALPGIPLHTRPTAPRQIPYHAGASYLEIDKSHKLWDEIARSGVLTLHVAGTFPNLTMTLWAIK